MLFHVLFIELNKQVQILQNSITLIFQVDNRRRLRNITAQINISEPTES